MTIFIINFIMVFIYWFFYRELCKKYGESKYLLNLLMIIISVQMILLMGLRSQVIGKDTAAYAIRFNKYSQYSVYEILADRSQEIGYSLLIKLVSFFTDNFQWFLIIVSMLSIIPIMFTITRCSKKPFLSVLLFIAFDYFAFMFSGMRQGVAYGLCFSSYLFIRERKLFKFLFVVFLATLFHKSAYLFIPAYFIAHTKVNKKTIALMIVSYIFVFIFKEKIFGFIAETMYDYYEIKNTNPFGFLVLVFMVAIVGILFKNNAIKTDKSFSCSLMILCTGAVLLPFITIGDNAKRLVEYYSIFMILVIPGVLDGIDDEKVYMLSNIGVIVGLISLFIIYLLADGYWIIPYIPFWNY